MTTIETRGKRSILGKIVMTLFLLWNAYMGFSLINFLATIHTNPVLKSLTGETLDAAVGAGFMTIIFVWSLSALVLGTFVIWTRGPKIITTIKD